MGHLITSGPYAFTRNPLYLGNGFMWAGFVALSGLLWMLPIALTFFVLQGSALVQWEEALLLERYPEEYRQYAARVPRWIPAWNRPAAPALPHPWTHVLFSERGTLLAILLMLALLLTKEASYSW